MHEHPKPCQEALFIGREQREAPFEQCDQIAVAVVASGNLADQEAEAMIEPLQHLFRREQREARRRELQGKRHAIEPFADADDRRGIVQGQFEFRPNVIDAGQQQRHRRCRRDLLQLALIRGLLQGGQLKRRQTEHAFAHEAQLLLRGGQNLQLLSSAQNFNGQRAHFCGETIAVVEQQQRATIREDLRDLAEQFALAGRALSPTRAPALAATRRRGASAPDRRTKLHRDSDCVSLSERQRALGFAHPAGPEQCQRAAAIQKRIDLMAVHCPGRSGCAMGPEDVPKRAAQIARRFRRHVAVFSTGPT